MLNLIDQDQIQLNWALVLDGNPPTISQYERDPTRYNALPHGLYEIQAERHKDVWDYHGGFRMRMPNGYRIKVQVSHVCILDEIASGNIQYNGSIVTVKGRFDKRGSEILFIPGSE